MIVGVAISNNKTGLIVSLPKPNRHNHVIRKIIEEQGIPKVTSTEWTQGFITDCGAFLNRKQALNYAWKLGQIPKDSKISTLTSEDLW